jgi:hypothetical protein
MADEQVATLTEPTPGNAEAARTATGEIKDQQSTRGSPQSQSGNTQTETKTETKSETEAKTEGDKKPDAKADVVPDKYELTAPEGYEVDKAIVEEVTPLFKELKLTQAQAQSLTDVWNKHSIEAAKSVEEAVTNQRNSWREEVAKATDIGDGKDGLKPEVRKNIDAAISTLGDAKAIADFKSAMDFTGAGDNPAFIRAMNQFGKLLGEGTPVRGAGPAPVTAPGAGPKNAAQALYPNLPSSATP